jgi:hypothetical protein
MRIRVMRGGLSQSPLQPGLSASQHRQRQNSGARLPTLQIQRIGDRFLVSKRACCGGSPPIRQEVSKPARPA